jgi:hypothetical protein
VRVWKILEHYPEYIDEDESYEHLVAECLHTASVYGVVAVVNSTKEFIYIITVCYDGYVRLWKSSLSGGNRRGEGT